MSDNEITAKFQREELQKGWDEQAQPSRHRARLLIGARTDLGKVRENNEDKFEFFLPSSPAVLARKGHIIAVSDGMGGHAAGQIAAELALKQFIRSYYSQNHADVESALRTAVQEANATVHSAASIPGREGMGCTLTAAAVRGQQAWIAQVGDSRGYLYRGGGLQRLTEDHSWVGEQVRLGVMEEEEAEMSPFRNVITRAMGTHPQVEPDIYPLGLQEGDVLMLCSDGLSGVVRQDQMQAVLSSGGPAESCQELVEMALDGGGPDNATVLIARVEAIEEIAEEDLQEPLPQREEQETSDEAEEPKRHGLFGMFGRKG